MAIAAGEDGVLLCDKSTVISVHADQSPIARIASAGLLRLIAALVVKPIMHRRIHLLGLRK